VKTLKVALVFGLTVVFMLTLVAGFSSCTKDEPTPTTTTPTTQNQTTTTNQLQTNAPSTKPASTTPVVTTTESSYPTTTSTPVTTTTNTQIPTTPAATSQPPATTTETGEGLDDVLGYTATIRSIYYDMVTSAPGQAQFTTSFWIESPNMRSEMEAEGETVVMLVNNEEKSLYMYMPEQNMAMKMAYEPSESALEETIQVTEYEPVVTGTETLDGKLCLVVEHSNAGNRVKTWIWKEKGFPLKVETVTSEGAMVVEYKNISFDDIPDEMFEIPAGVNIMDIPSPGA
jgi:hypothetical protein